MIIDNPSKRILRFKDVQKLIPFSRSYIYNLISQGRFPAQVKLIEGGRGAGWWEHEIQDYVNQRYTEHVAD
ncbi:AlpA family phage regulatory protein [Porticoccaceae bacterium]|jgi:prophage regulatory protein|nr:AlpA family phage regulatory protein [Porticoccaceae bacterium]MDA8879359.1 AlpA family phage regulatory protein [Porticoccaceae bacterium]